MLFDVFKRMKKKKDKDGGETGKGGGWISSSNSSFAPATSFAIDGYPPQRNPAFGPRDQLERDKRRYVESIDRPRGETGGDWNEGARAGRPNVVDGRRIRDGQDRDQYKERRTEDGRLGRDVSYVDMDRRKMLVDSNRVSTSPSRPPRSLPTPPSLPPRISHTHPRIDAPVSPNRSYGSHACPSSSLHSPVSSNSHSHSHHSRASPASSSDIYPQACASPPIYSNPGASYSSSPPALPPRTSPVKDTPSVRQVVPSLPTSPNPVSAFATPVLPGGFPSSTSQQSLRLPLTPPRRPEIPSPKAQRRPISYQPAPPLSTHRLSPQPPSRRVNVSRPILPFSASAPTLATSTNPRAPVASPSSARSRLSSPLRDLPTQSSRQPHSTQQTQVSALVENNRRCRGTIASGTRCTRIVASEASPGNSNPSSPSRKVRRGLPLISGDQWDEVDELLRRSKEEYEERDDAAGLEFDTDEQKVARFCHQHRNQALVEVGCFIVTAQDSKGEFIAFDDWISPHLSPSTQLLLRHEMTREISPNDHRRGYIYVHQLVETKKLSSPRSSSSAAQPSTILIKVGRSVSPVARLAQWRASCPSRQPIVRDILPRAASASRNAGLGVTLSLRDQGVQLHHRWERLCLIEIAGLQAHRGREKSLCRDCGKGHVELFEVDAETGYESIVEVVERWMRWVERINVLT